ncbi:MAG: DUF87 domain-containing protein [Bauldia sp.]
MSADQSMPAGTAASDAIASVLSVHGSQAAVGLSRETLQELKANPPTVGKFLGISRGDSLLIGLVTDVTVEMPQTVRDLGYHAVANIDLLGEIRNASGSDARFQRGVSNYPAIGDRARLMGGRDLRLVYGSEGADCINVGALYQDETIGAFVRVDDLLRKHFAVLGTTGVGKSSGVALLLREIMKARPDLRVFVLDGHNEYGHCFGPRAQVFNPANLRLPFWLFNFEETVDVLFGARPGIDEEMEILAEVIPLAKGMYCSNRAVSDRPGLKRLDSRLTGFTVDAPVPYRIEDLVQLIDERMGRLENRTLRGRYLRLMSRIEAVRNDPHYRFMFDNANVGGDTMADVLREIFCLQPGGPTVTVMQLAGFPVEVVDSVVSVLCRTAFDLGLWSDGALPMLFVCEEAHRYASADRTIGFGPTRKALSRIAKEGRKYGVFLGLVTQRPAELDATIISQCSTFFAMRMANERDQALLKSAVSDAGANLLGFIPSLGMAEVLAFGEGVALPIRLRFHRLPEDAVPRSEAVFQEVADAAAVKSTDFVEVAIEKWRGAHMSSRRRSEEAPPVESKPAEEPPQQRQTLERQRARLKEFGAAFRG